MTAPSDLTATAVSNSQINLTWSDNEESKDGYKIERKDEINTEYQLIAEVGSNSYSNTGLADSTTYTYRVMAYRNDDVSAPSAPASATTQSAAHPERYSFFLCDHLGNTRVVVDHECEVKEFYDYYPFGKIQRSSVIDK